MKEFTCVDCLHHNNNVCLTRHVELPHKCGICPFFADKDGKRPRFCRVASSVDKMARAIVCEHVVDNDFVYFIVSTNGKCFDDYETAVEEAKAWLMEVEK